LSGLSRNQDLFGMRMGVGCVDLEPLFDRVAAVLAVGTLAFPFRFAHAIEDLRSRSPRGFEDFERRLDRAIVIEPARELLLVVTDDLGSIASDQKPETNRRRHLAVG